MKAFLSAVLLLFACSLGYCGSGAMPVPLMDGAASAPKVIAIRPCGAGASDGRAFDVGVLLHRYGTVVEKRPMGIGGLTAWTLEKNGHRVMLYTTADGQAVISGVVWDTFTGRNISEQLGVVTPGALPLPATTGPSAAHTPEPLASSLTGALVGAYSGPIPESIKAVDSLAGIKEGKGGAADTLYVIFDPRCPYCRKAYGATRDYVKRGFSIKWIPAVALGHPEDGIPLAATVVQAKPAEQADILRRVLGDKEPIRTTPTKATADALAQNLDFFYSAFRNNSTSGTMGVPVGFFLDKKTGSPRMITGVSELPVIQSIFGRL
jgi:thiol:disulfide interchange protein DsbG